MGKRESYEPGTFCWTDLSTPDRDGAKAFYGGLFGWEFRDDEIPGGVYTTCLVDGDEVAAIVQQGETTPHWNNYVSVASADDTVAQARELGAKVIEEPFDIMESGRLGVFADPGGAMLCVWEPREHIGSGRVNDPGCMTWNELQTSDPGAAGEFYSALFGWGIGPIEQDGTLVYTTLENAGSKNGGFMPMTEQPAGAPSVWLSYFTVSSCDEALEQARMRGGALFTGPLDLPGGRIAVLGDPQGAAFAVFEGPVDD